jgi:hypothetical protein
VDLVHRNPWVPKIALDDALLLDSPVHLS